MALGNVYSFGSAIPWDTTKSGCLSYPISNKESMGFSQPFFFFFLSIKSKYINNQNKETRSEEPRNTRDVYKRALEHKQQQNKNYLLPNQVKKSTIEEVLSTLCRLAQNHELVTKLALILWTEGASF